MDDFTILQQMIKPAATIPLEEHNGKFKVELIEAEQDYSITISNLPEHSLIIKADSFPAPDSIFNGKRGECRRADYIIIANSEKKKVILCIELKKTKADRKHIEEQLTGAQCLMRYCQTVGEHFWQQHSFLNDYVYRFISIGHISIAKQRTRITRDAGTHDTPQNMMKIDWPHYLPFNKLV